MSITQTGNHNQASSGDKSTNTQIVNCAAKNAGWFIGGILLPTIAGLIVEILKSGKVSSLLAEVLKFLM